MCLHGTSSLWEVMIVGPTSYNTQPLPSFSMGQVVGETKGAGLEIGDSYGFVLWGLFSTLLPTRIATHSPLCAPAIPSFVCRFALYCALLRPLGLRLCQRASCSLPLGGYWGVLRSV